MKAGFVPLRLEFFEKTGGQALRVSYRGPDTGGSKINIPAWRLVTPRSGGADVVVSAYATSSSAVRRNTFQDGLNNLRVWSSALGGSEVRQAMESSVIGNQPGLLELTFDDLQSPYGNAATFAANNHFLLLNDGLELPSDAYTLEARAQFPLPATPGN